MERSQINSPFSSRSHLSQSNLFSDRKGPFGKRTISDRFSVSNRSNQSIHVVAKSDQHIIENYGYPMPVLINEALTFSDKSAVVSVNFSNNGWSWAVCGRRLFVWQYKDNKIDLNKMEIRTPQRRNIGSQCRELTLPHCDIGHKASLVTVYLSDGQQMPSCLSVSPTGDVRYWPSIAHDNSSIDEAGILEGQEFEKIIELSSQDYLLATTTCNLVHLKLINSSGRHLITYKTIKPPSGFFTGIGKKFASIIIGLNSNQEKENKLIKICAENNSQLSNWQITILSDRWIQLWSFRIQDDTTANENFLFEDCELITKIRENFHKIVWNYRNISEVEIWTLDMHTTNTETYILASALVRRHSPQMYYGLIKITDDGQMIDIKRFYLLKFTTFFSQENENECLSMKFILNRSSAFIYGDKTIYPLLLGDNDSEDFEKIDLPSQDDRILFAANFQNLPLFFSRQNGLVCVTSSDFDNIDCMNASVSEFYTSKFDLSTTMQGGGGGGGGTTYKQNNSSLFLGNTSVAAVDNLTIYDLDADMIYKESSDAINQMKAAFIYFLKNNQTTCNGILKELFPDEIQTTQADSLLDVTVTQIVTDLAEDIPASDPRWEHRDFIQRKALGSSTSLKIAQQLKDKNLALNHFVEFLNGTSLWNKLSIVTYKGTVKPTIDVIADINEKIIACIALKSIHNKYLNFINDAINKVVDSWNITIPTNLTQQDLFYVRVTEIQDFFHILAKIARDSSQSQQTTQQISKILIDINTIILMILSKVLSVRALKKSMLNDKTIQILPWTSVNGKYGIYDPIIDLINITLKYGARSTGEPESRQQHYVHLYELIDFILDGKVNFLESIKGNDEYKKLLKDYEIERSKLINNLIEDGQYDLATKLAEKYLDFACLIIICDETSNQKRLDDYIERYKDKDFSQYAIQWHILKEKKGEIFNKFKHNQKELTKFLQNHPSLAWVQNVFNNDFKNACETLIAIALNEKEYVSRKKTMLSLAKLSALTCENNLNDKIEEINLHLQLISYQEQLSVSILNVFGYDIDNPKVMTAEEIINLFISEENDSSTEIEYRKALELTKFVEFPNKSKHEIWCSAILRDSWSNYDTNAPLNVLKQMLFFKLIDVCCLLDGSLDFLPPINVFLNSPELSELTGSKSFQFLLKFGYEYIFDCYKPQ